MNTFQGRGNLAAAPEIKTVQVGGEGRTVAEFRAYFDRPVPVSGATGEFEDKGGFWLDCNLWGPRAESLAILPRGARVHVEGTLIEESWTDKEGNNRSTRRLIADYVALDLGRLESVTLRSRQRDSVGGPEHAPESRPQRGDWEDAV